MNRGAGLLLAAVPLAAVLPLVTASPAQAVRSCMILEVTGRSGLFGQDANVLLARTLPSDTATTIGTLPVPVNAIGADGALTYGLTEDGDVERITTDGRESDLGPLRGHGRVEGAVGGTVAGDRWYVQAGDRLFQIELDPSSAAYLHVVASVELDPGFLAVGIDDFDLDPSTGAFYGIAQEGFHDRVVRIDATDGEVTPIGAPVPGGRGYGAVSFGPDGALYVRQDDIDGRSVRYQITLGGQATQLSSGPEVSASDATGCLPMAPPPPPPPPTTTPAPPPPTRTTHVPPPPPGRTPPPPTRTTTPAPTTSTSPATTTRPAPSTTSSAKVVPPPPPSATTPAPPPPPLPGTIAPTNAVRAAQRQWSIALLALILLGAAGARGRLGRARKGRP